MAEAKPDYQKVLEEALINLVNHPQDVVVDRKIDEMGVLLSVKVNPQDMGLLIGRKGETAKALRTIIRTIGMKSHARVNVKIEEPEGSERKFEDRKKPVHVKGEGLDDVINELKK